MSKSREVITIKPTDTLTGDVISDTDIILMELTTLHHLHLKNCTIIGQGSQTIITGTTLDGCKFKGHSPTVVGCNLSGCENVPMLGTNLESIGEEGRTMQCVLTGCEMRGVDTG